MLDVQNAEQVTIDPSILYFGTPVVLVSTVGPDGQPTSPRCRRSSGWGTPR
ncbi:hypothetical protein NKG05_01960 [Oerskovia sp. M15]